MAHALGEWLREVPLIPVLLVAVIAGMFLNDDFFTSSNISNVLSQSSVLAVLVVGQTLVLIAGRMDLSQESVVSLAPLLAAWLMVGPEAGGTGAGLNPYLGLILTIAVGVLVGIVNGVLVIKGRLNPFVATLAMLILLAGLASAVARGNSFFGIPDPYLYLGSAEWLGLNVSVWLAAFSYIAVGLFMRYHRIGRAVYAIGGNEKAATAAGINASRTPGQISSSLCSRRASSVA
jgi:ribose/xylose/arabinose/galactoside ABC-type transport system permease subunit